MDAWPPGRSGAVAAAMAPMAEMVPNLGVAFAAQARFAVCQAGPEVLKLKGPSEKLVRESPSRGTRARSRCAPRAIALCRAGAGRVGNRATRFQGTAAFSLSKASDSLTIIDETLAARMSADSAEELSEWRRALGDSGNR